MLFSRVIDLQSPFAASSLDAINLYGYFKSKSFEDCKAGCGCNINEFEVTTALLELAVYLNYTPMDKYDSAQLQAHLEDISSSLDFEDDEPAYTDLVGVKLLYLIFAEKDAAYLDNLDDENQVIIDSIKATLDEYISTFDSVNA